MIWWEAMSKRIKNPKKDLYINFAFNIQPILLKIGLFLMFLLVVIQVMHYFHSTHDIHRPSYHIRQNLSTKNIAFNYGVIRFTANVDNDDILIVKVNGIPVEEIENNKPVSVYVSPIDVLEIDATKAKGSYEVTIDAEPSSFLPENYIKSIIVHGKLYRLPPLY